MKNKAVSFGVLLCLCMTASPVWANHHNCKPNSNKIVLNVDKHHLELKDNNKKVVCLLNNGTFNIEIKQTGNPDIVVLPSHVDIAAKPGVNISLVRQPVDDNLNYITVKVTTANPGPTQEAEYTIIVDEVGELDPRVRVVGGRMLQDIQYESIDQYLRETFGMSLEDAKALSPPDETSY